MTPPKSRSTRREGGSLTVVECKLAPYGRGVRYKATLANGKVVWLKRTTAILQNLAKHSLYRWHSVQTANYWQDKIARGETPNYWESVAAPERVRDEAADIGKQIHACIEAYLKHGVMWDESLLSPEASYGLASWLAWWKESGYVASQVELVVWSLIGGYGGTIDLLIKDGDGWILVDFKTSTSLHPSYYWQKAAYTVALTEMGLGPVYRAEIIKIPKVVGESLSVNVAWDRDSLHRRDALVCGWIAFLTACNSLPEIEESQEQAALPIPYLPEYAGHPAYTEDEVEEIFAGL